MTNSSSKSMRISTSDAVPANEPQTIQKALEGSKSTIKSAGTPGHARTLIFSGNAPAIVRLDINVDRETARSQNLAANRGTLVSSSER